MEGENESERRMSTLCRKLGRMWLGTKVTMNELVLKKKVKGLLSSIFFGRLHTNINVNFQVF